MEERGSSLAEEGLFPAAPPPADDQPQEISEESDRNEAEDTDLGATVSCDESRPDQACAGPETCSSRGSKKIEDGETSEGMDGSDSCSEEKKRQKIRLARDLLCNVRDKATNLISSTKSSSYIAKFGIETIETLGHPLKSFTVSQWETYGEPLLTTFDDTIDRAITAVKNPFSSGADEKSSSGSSYHPPSTTSASYNIYWERVKQLFLRSRWFAEVDKILKENGILKFVNKSVLRPAEIFFNTATDVFCVQNSLDGFLTVLKNRVGPVWDSRLGDLAKSFFNAAKKVSDSFGAHKCLQGFFHLKRAREDMAVDDLVSHFESALQSRSAQTMDCKRISDGERRQNSCHSNSSESEIMRLKGAACQSSGSRKKRGPMEKTYRRYRQPNPYARQSMPQALKRRLKQKRWFSQVDNILRQNDFIKALPKRIVPSNHFFETAMRLLNNPTSTASIENSCTFSNTLKTEMGFAWDGRLGPLANDFYHTMKLMSRRQKYDEDQRRCLGYSRGASIRK